MSTIKPAKHQIGLDVTPSNNIVLTQDAGDLIVNQGVHDGVLTEVARIGTGGLKYTPAGLLWSVLEKTSRSKD